MSAEYQVGARMSHLERCVPFAANACSAQAPAGEAGILGFSITHHSVLRTQHSLLR